MSDGSPVTAMAVSNDSSFAMDATELEVLAPPGAIGLAFNAGDPGLVNNVAESSPLRSVVDVGMVLTSVDGANVTLLSSRELIAFLKSRATRERSLKFRVSRPVDAESLVTKTLVIPGEALHVKLRSESRPPTISSIDPESPLLGEVAIGAVVLAIDGIDVSSLTFREAHEIYDVARTRPFYTLKVATPVVRNVNLAYVQFIPRKVKNKPGGNNKTFENLPSLIDRANHWLITSQLDFVNIETVSIDGSIKEIESTRYLVRGGDSPTLCYTFLRVWYNRRAPSNLVPSVRSAIAAHEAQTQKDIDTAKNTHDCVVS